MSCGPETAALNVLTQVGAAETNVGSPPTAATIAFEVINDQIMLNQQNLNLNDETLTGTRSALAIMEVPNIRSVTGDVRANPTMAMLDWQLTKALGGTPTHTGTPPTYTYPLAEAVPCFDWFALRGGSVFMFRECKINQLSLSGSYGGPINSTMSVVGKDRDDPPTIESWPGSATPDLTLQPWMFSSVTLTIAGTAYQIFDFAFRVDNQLQPRQVNSPKPTEFYSSGRIVQVDLGMPWGGSQTLLTALKSATQVAVVITATAGSATPSNTVRTLTLSMPTCIVENLRDPIVPGRPGEIHFPLQFRAFAASGAGSELTATILKPS